jgi:hypothetical protein
MAHTAHSMAHPMHAVESRIGRSKSGAVIDSLCPRHPVIVTTAHMSSAFPMNAAVFVVNGPRVPRMRSCLGGTVRIAHELAKIQAVIVRNFSPALAQPVQRDDIVETLPSRVR